MSIKQLVRKQIKNIAENFGLNNILGWEIDGTGAYIISYPKSGRTWLRTLVGKALCDYYQIDEKFLIVKMKTFIKLEKEKWEVIWIIYLKKILTILILILLLLVIIGIK